MELSEQPLAVKKCCTIRGSMWHSVVVHEHWPVSLDTTAFWGGGVTVWGCFSFDCKLDWYVLDGNLTGQKYRENVLAPRVVPHFDNHALADRPMFMDGLL
jgi:hypothetical protein